MTCYYPTHQWRSSQDSNKSLIKSWRARGRSPSKSLRELNANPDRGSCTIKHSWQCHKQLLLGAVTNLPKILLNRMIPQKEFNLWKPFPNWDDFKNPRELPQQSHHLSNRPATWFISPTKYRFTSLSLPLWLLQIQGPQLRFPSRLLYNP